MGLFDGKAHKEEPEIKKKRKNNVVPFQKFDDEKKRNLGMIFSIYMSIIEFNVIKIWCR